MSLAALKSEAMRRASLVWTAALDLVYPPACMSCTGATTQSGTLCADCWSKVRFIERPFCERLGTPFAQDLGAGLLSPDAVANPPVFQRARAVARYEDGPARQLVHRLKYGDRL
jgi:predicted amidophosphoribosyltransferase